MTFGLLLGIAANVLFERMASLPLQVSNAVTRESTETATVDRIERSSRVVTLRGESNLVRTVYVDPKVAVLNELQVGDVVTIRFVESVIVQVRPNAKPSAVRDTTEAARKTRGDQVVGQAQVVVTIDDIDSERLFVSYRTQDGQKQVRAVNDKRLLEGLRAGDRVEITVTRERAVDIQRRRR